MSFPNDNESKATEMINFINEKEKEFINDNSLSSRQAVNEIYSFFFRLARPAVYEINISEFLGSEDDYKNTRMIIKNLQTMQEISLEGSAFIGNKNVEIDMLVSHAIKKIYYNRLKILEKLAKRYGWSPYLKR